MPNRNLLTPRSRIRPPSTRQRKSGAGQPLRKSRDVYGGAGALKGRVSISSVLFNWAGLVALWALPYLTLLDHLRLDVARSETLQWSLLFIGVLGLISILYTAWKETLDPAWRAKHGFTLRRRPDRTHTENIT